MLLEWMRVWKGIFRGLAGRGFDTFEVLFDEDTQFAIFADTLNRMDADLIGCHPLMNHLRRHSGDHAPVAKIGAYVGFLGGGHAQRVCPFPSWPARSGIWLNAIRVGAAPVMPCIPPK